MRQLEMRAQEELREESRRERERGSDGFPKGYRGMCVSNFRIECSVPRP